MTHAAVLTPAGRSAIAVVGVEGPGATSTVEACFLAANGKPLAKQPLRAIRFGRWLHPKGEELVVVRRSESGVEIHCHGGLAAQSAVLANLAEKGIAQGEVSSFGSRKTPLSQAAWKDLEQATTERVAGILLDQANGALDASLKKILVTIQDNDSKTAASEIEKLLSWRSLGEHLLTPWLVAIVGPPNVGKSSLINALVGYDRAIVFDQPGTTRDVVTAGTAINGWPVRLADTAGLHRTTDPIEAAGIELAHATLRSAEVAVFVQEASDASGSLPEGPEGVATKAIVLRVASKADLADDPSFIAERILTSVVSGQGMAELLEQIGSAIVPANPPAGSGIPFRSEHYAQLTLASESLQKKNLAAAHGIVEALLAGPW